MCSPHKPTAEVAIGHLRKVDYLSLAAATQMVSASQPGSSKGRYSHHAGSDALLREWSDGLYLEDQAAYQRFMEDVFAKGVRAMGLAKKMAIS